MPVGKFDVFIMRVFIVLAIISLFVFISLNLVSAMEKKKLNHLYEKQIEQNKLVNDEYRKLNYRLQSVLDQIQCCLDAQEGKAQ